MPRAKKIFSHATLGTRAIGSSAVTLFKYSFKNNLINFKQRQN
jgi:hypothetical protein